MRLIPPSARKSEYGGEVMIVAVRDVKHLRPLVLAGMKKKFKKNLKCGKQSPKKGAAGVEWTCC